MYFQVMPRYHGMRRNKWIIIIENKLRERVALERRRDKKDKRAGEDASILNITNRQGDGRRATGDGRRKI